MEALPSDIHVGMKVYDNERRHIGHVDDFKYPENAGFEGVEPAEIDGTDKRGHESLIEALAEAFGGEDLPEVLRERLLTQGYIRLEADGLFAADRYVFPDQIASTTADEVMLNVAKDQLVKTH